VLLAGLTGHELGRYLAGTDLRPLTARTIRDAADLRARLGEVRDQGWAMVDQELEEGLRSVAAPVRDANGRIIAALGMSSTTAITDAATMRDRFVPIITETAGRISERLGAGFADNTTS
jgi:IclR family pca regulon transcriptional regulator